MCELECEHKKKGILKKEVCTFVGACIFKTEADYKRTGNNYQLCSEMEVP